MLNKKKSIKSIIFTILGLTIILCSGLQVSANQEIITDKDGKVDTNASVHSVVGRPDDPTPKPTPTSTPVPSPVTGDLFNVSVFGTALLVIAGLGTACVIVKNKNKNT